MFSTQSRIGTAKVAAALVVAGLGLSACATRGYVDEQVATLNSRINAVDEKATDAIQRADAANSAAVGAAGSASSTNARIDQLNSRIDGIEQRMTARQPRN